MTVASVSLNLPAGYHEVSRQQQDIRLVDDGRHSLATSGLQGRQVAVLSRQNSRLGVFGAFKGALQRSLGEVAETFAKRSTAHLDVDTIKAQNKYVADIMKKAYSTIEQKVASDLGVSTAHRPPNEAVDRALDGATLHKAIDGYRQGLESVHAQIKQLPGASAEHVAGDDSDDTDDTELLATTDDDTAIEHDDSDVEPIAPPRRHRDATPTAPPRTHRNVALPGGEPPVAPPRTHKNVARPQTPQS